MRNLLIVMGMLIIAGTVWAQDEDVPVVPACNLDNVELARSNLDAVQEAIEIGDLEAAVVALDNLGTDVEGMLLYCDRSPEGVLRRAYQALFTNDVDTFVSLTCTADRDDIDADGSLLGEDVQAAADLSGLELFVEHVEPDLVNMVGSGYVWIVFDGDYQALTGEELLDDGVPMIREDGEWRICESVRERTLGIDDEPDAGLPVFDVLAITERYAGLSQMFTNDGMPMLGDGAVEVILFTSYSCLVCEFWHHEMMGQLVERVHTGEVHLVVVPLQVGSIPNAGRATLAAFCAGDQGMYFEMHDALFYLHDVQQESAFTSFLISHAVDTLELDGASFDTCMANAETAERIDVALDILQANAVIGVPTVLVNGSAVPIETLFDAIDGALNE